MTPEEISVLPYRPCVGLVVRNAKGLIFAGERIDTPGAWQMPQGGVDAGEDARAAALRELVEETSIRPEAVEIVGETAEGLRYDLPVEVIPHRWGGRYRGQEQKWFLLAFRGQDAEIRLETAEPEFARWQWMAAADLLESIVPFKRDLYARVFAEFGL
ncbi:MAG: RNA pyrophosphohydrolase [Pseudomonadota bacterium]